MHHQRLAGIAKRRFQPVGVAEVEGDVELRVGVQHTGRDMIKAFGRMPVAHFGLRPEFARPAADRIGLQKRVSAGFVDLPDFQLAFLLEDAHQDRAFRFHALLRHLGDHLARQFRRRLGEIVERHAARQRNAKRKRCQCPRHECAGRADALGGAMKGKPRIHESVYRCKSCQSFVGRVKSGQSLI